jgi:hypothetical protein
LSRWRQPGGSIGITFSSKPKSKNPKDEMGREGKQANKKPRVNMFRIMFLLWCDPVREADVSEIVFPPV